MGSRIGSFLRLSSSELYPHLVEYGGYLRIGVGGHDPAQ